MNARTFFNNQDSWKNQRRSTVSMSTPMTAGATACHKLNINKCQDFKRETIAKLTSTCGQISPKNAIEKENQLRQIALGKAHQGNYDEVIQILSWLIDRNRGNANDYNNRGLAYFQSGQADRAIADYNKAIAIKSDLAGAYNNRANYYASIGRLEDAIADYDTTIDLNPVHVRAWLNQGITFRDLGQHEQAIENFDFALRLGWLKGHIYAERGRTYHILGDWNYAIADYHRAIEHFSQSTNTNAGVGGRLRQQVETWLNELLSPLQA